MSDYLVGHARQNVWCTPHMDRQVIFNAKRITAPQGAKTYIQTMWSRFPLPNTTQRFHVFQIGQIHPLLIGLLPKRRIWYRLSDAMMQDNLMADVYLTNGLQMPRKETWILYTEDRAVLMAVADQPSIANIREQDVFLRLYSNTFFSSPRSDDFAHQIKVSSRRFTTVADALLFQQAYNTQRLQRGLTSLYINGRFQLTFLPQNLRAGDTMEYVYDSTVKQVVEFPLSAAPAFDSTKDSKRKYLLTHAGDQVGGQIIDYRDDIDVYLVRTSMQGSQVQRLGHYFHKNRDDAFRMVTHRDYSVAIPYIQAYVDDHPELGAMTDLTIRLHIRHSGYSRPLIHEHHRIHELYKLPYRDRVMAMHGVESTVSVWQVANLEASFYTKIMDAFWSDVTPTVVESAYGYNGAAKLIADSPIRVAVNSGVREVPLPYGLRYGATMFEYDVNGRLMGFYYYAGGAVYRPYNSACVLVEGMVGKGAYKISTVFGGSATIKPGLDYRFYMAPITSQGVRHDLWEDVTDDPTKYNVINGHVVWDVDTNFWATAVKSDDEFLAYNLDMAPIDGLLKFSVDGSAVYPAGSAQGVMFIPVGKLELWLNGNALIENLDYFVKWPEVVVVNKEYLKAGNAQRITVRGSGFCRPDMSREPVADYGFVRYGVLSKNTRYNVRDDRVMRMVVRGRVFHRDALRFSETDHQLYIDDVANGSPYLIDDVVVPIRDLVGTNNFDFRDRSRAVDTAVEDYLTRKLPEPLPTTPNMIPNKYWLYSPFITVVMYHLLNGFLSLENFRGQYSDHDVLEALEGYTYLLDFEPTRQELDLELVSIHPHDQRQAVVLDIYQRNFLARAVKVFLDNKVDLSQFIEVDNTIG